MKGINRKSLQKLREHPELWSEWNDNVTQLTMVLNYNALIGLMLKYPEISIEKWKNLIATLSENQKETVLSKNGESLLENNNFPKNTVHSITTNYTRAINNIEKRLNSNVSKKQKEYKLTSIGQQLLNLIKEHPEISIEEWYNLIKTLRNNEQEEIYIVNGKSLQETNSLPAVSYNSHYVRYSNAVKKLRERVENKEQSLDPFFFQFKEYGKQKTFWAFILCSEKRREVAFLKYGENLNKFNSLSKKTSHAKSYYSATLSMLKKEMFSILKEEAKVPFIKKHTKEEFVPVLSNLTLEEMKIFIAFHSENYNELCLVTSSEEHTLKYYIEEYLKIVEKLETEMTLAKSKKIVKISKVRKENLSQKEYDVLVLRYGLKDGRKRILKEVGEILNIDKSYVCQIEKRALQKIKENPRIWNNWCQDEEKVESDLMVLLNEQPKGKAQHKATIQPKVEKTKKTRKTKDIFVVYTKEEYLFANRFLTKQEQEIFISRYGKNLDELNPWPKNTKYNYNQKIQSIIKKMQKNIEKYRQKVQKEFLRRLLDCTFEEVRMAIPSLPKLEQEVLILKRGKSLLEYNSYPSNKPYNYYKKIEEDTIFHLKDIIRENRKIEESTKQEEIEKIKRQTIERRNQLLAEKLNNMKIKLFQDLWKIYAGIITRDTLKDTIEGIVVDEKISEIEYFYKIENSILVRAANLYKENKDTTMSSLLLEQLKQIFTAKIKTKNPLYTKEQIEKAIEKVWTSYDGEYRFEDVVKRNLKQQ